MDFINTNRILEKIVNKEELNQHEMRNIEFGLKLIDIYNSMLDEALGLSNNNEFKFKFKFKWR